MTVSSEDRGRMLEALRTVFGFDDFRPRQSDVIDRALAGQDTLALMPTAAGKSLCYQLPALLLDGCVVVISPLIALMKDQVDGLPTELARVAAMINSSLDRDARRKRLVDLASGRLRLVYVAPERLRQLSFIDAARRAGVSLFVVDEAHCVSLWGHDFRPDYLFIRDALELLGAPPLLALTATATPVMVEEIGEELGRRIESVSTGILRSNLHLSFERLPNNPARQRRLRELCQQLDGPGIVYVSAQSRADQLAGVLRSDGIAADSYHAGLTSAERSASQDRFMTGQTRVMVATVALGLGVDKMNVRFVVHNDLPPSLERYVQEVGRAGRDDLPARCVALVTPGDRGALSLWLSRDRPSIDLVRAVDRALRGRAEKGLVQVAPDDLIRDVQEEFEADVDETQARVAISVLERAGLARRRLDLPRAVSVHVNRGPVADEEFRAFVRRARLPIGRWLPLGTAELADRAGISLLEIEQMLLSWRAQGFLSYSASGHDLCVELGPPPEDPDSRIWNVLDAMGEAQGRRLKDVFAYVESPECRHAQIARYFGTGPPISCSACDRCAPEHVKLRERLDRFWATLTGR